MNSTLSTIVRLSVMMFLQFFMWGAWYVTCTLCLGKVGYDATSYGGLYSVGPIAGMISPFFVGMIADRFFATERVLGVMHLLGAGLMFLNYSLMGKNLDLGGISAPTFHNFLFFLHMLCFFPTLALSNTLAMKNIPNVEKYFPVVRVFGTIGWIVAGWTVSWLNFDDNKSFEMFLLAAGAGALLGVYSFTLPHTPPPAKGKSISVNEILGFDAMVLLSKPSYMIFIICSLLVCIPLAFYYQLAAKFAEQSGLNEVGTKMSYGQISEIFFMLMMPLLFSRLGVKWMLVLGVLAWVVRYGLFAAASSAGVEWMILAGIILHGICYDLFFVTGQIYTDKVAPEEIRGQAQGMLVLFTLGVGMLIGAQTCGQVEAFYTTGSGKDAVVDWQSVWTIPALGAAGVLTAFLLFFREERSAAR